MPIKLPIKYGIADKIADKIFKNGMYKLAVYFENNQREFCPRRAGPSIALTKDVAENFSIS